jgi:hypothetical protein
LEALKKGGKIRVVSPDFTNAFTYTLRINQTLSGPETKISKLSPITDTRIHIIKTAISKSFNNSLLKIVILWAIVVNDELFTFHTFYLPSKKAF